MGLDRYIYIGPYLRVTDNVQKKTIDECARHNRPDDANYCPCCGRATDERYTTVDTDCAQFNWRDDFKINGQSADFDDYLFSIYFVGRPPLVQEINGKRTRTYIFLPNRYGKEIGIHSFENCTDEFSIDRIDIANSVEKFSRLFDAEIIYLKQWFTVELRYGYVSYVS